MSEHFSRSLNIPVSILRLNYAIDLRYGVLADLARRVWAGETIDVPMQELDEVGILLNRAHAVPAAYPAGN